MTGLSGKERTALSYLYELPEFKAFQKLCTLKRQKAADLIIQQDMSVTGADVRISMLQGQVYALEMIVLEMRKIHKTDIEKATVDQKH